MGPVGPDQVVARPQGGDRADDRRLLPDPQVQEAATVGVPCPVLGERTHAFVYAPGHTRHADLQEALAQWCKTRLADYKVPDHWTWLEAPLPRNANGKVIKTALREQARITR